MSVYKRQLLYPSMCIEMSSQSYQFDLQYSPYDFYSSTQSEDVPDENKCKVLEEELKLGNFECKEDHIHGEKCYQHALCKNRDLVKKLYNQRNGHLTSNEKYRNLHIKYNYALLKTFNLTVGIAGTLVFIYYYNK